MVGMLVLAFLFGATLGSFANVAILRWGKDESVLRPMRSYCFTCKNPIPWYDNIPILSWFLLKGKCRSCGTPFSIRYAMIELLTALLFVWVTWRFYPIQTNNLTEMPYVDATAFLFWPVVLSLVIITFTDLDEMIIPNNVTYPLTLYGFLIAVVAQVVPGLSGHLYVPHLFGTDTVTFIKAEYEYFDVAPLYGALAGGGTLYLIGVIATFILKKEAMGLGDVKLMMGVGAILGWKITLLTLLLGSVIGAVVGCTLILVGKASLGRQIPFGPYLAVASFLSLLYGNEIVQAVYWYFVQRPTAGF